MKVAILTGGGDRPYALGLAAALIAEGIPFDFIASDALEDEGLRRHPLVRFLNLRGDVRADAPRLQKMLRVMAYYWRLLVYALTSRAGVFHLLWNNKFEAFDRTFLMAYYRILGKRVVFTAHNVNKGKRDGDDSWLNRMTLRVQYALCDQVFVHTNLMREELIHDFKVPEEKACLIPFGINNTLPLTKLSRGEARQKLGLSDADRTILFFGNIAPYKGVEFLVRAFREISNDGASWRLILAGRPKGSEAYWAQIQEEIRQSGLTEKIVVKAEYIPDEDVEIYFKASDVLALPYIHIFQSGVLFLGYSFGLPVIASDVGGMKEDIEQGTTGWVCMPKDAADLARALRDYFASPVYTNLEDRRPSIRKFANEKYSWAKVGEITRRVYENAWNP